MDTADTVYQAINTLYHGAESSSKEKASIWLGEFQKSLHAWQVSDTLLHEKRDLESCYFSAQTMRSKIHYSFHELPVDSYHSLKDSILHHLNQCDASTNHIIVTQLSLALADLALQLPEWNSLINDLFERFGSPEKHSVLLELLTVLPEEVDSRSLRLSMEQREAKKHQFGSQSNMVFQFSLVGITEHKTDATYLTRVLKCLSSWFSIGALPLQSLTKSPLLTYLYELLGNRNTPSELHDAATDCVIKAIILAEDTQVYGELANALLAMVPQLQVAFHECVALELEDKVENFGRVFVELGESFLVPMIESPNLGFGTFTTLELILLCTGHHDYSLADMTFSFWYRLSEYVYQSDDFNTSVPFEPYVSRLLASLYKLCRFDTDHEGIPSENEEFCEFRSRVSECVKDVIFIVRSSSCMKQMASILSDIGPKGTWDEHEAALFIMTCIGKNVLPSEDEITPSVVQGVTSMTEPVHVCMRYTSLRFIEELNEWIDGHPEFLDDVFNFILKQLEDDKLSEIAVRAMEAICTTSCSKVTKHLDTILKICTLCDQLKLSSDATVGLLRTVATVLSNLSDVEFVSHFKQLVMMQAEPLSKIVHSTDVINGNSIVKKEPTKDPCLWLDRMASLFRNISPKMQNGSAHPCLPVIQEVWPLLSETCSKFQSDSRVLERSCRCIRFAIRCLGVHSTSLLEPLVTQIAYILGKVNTVNSCLLMHEHG